MTALFQSQNANLRASIFRREFRALISSQSGRKLLGKKNEMRDRERACEPSVRKLSYLHNGFLSWLQSTWAKLQNNTFGFFFISYYFFLFFFSSAWKISFEPFNHENIHSFLSLIRSFTRFPFLTENIAWLWQSWSFDARTMRILFFNFSVSVFSFFFLKLTVKTDFVVPGFFFCWRTRVGLILKSTQENGRLGSTYLGTKSS